MVQGKRFDMAEEFAGLEYHMREMALSDWTSGVNHARQEGKEEGQKEIARNLKAMGIPIGQIAQGTGLTIEQMDNLLAWGTIAGES
jgi:predicted transposase/invertase (TIGR01784 family)